MPREQHGKAEEAMRFYVSLFRDSRILHIQRYGPGEGEPEGTVKHFPEKIPEVKPKEGGVSGGTPTGGASNTQ